MGTLYEDLKEFLLVSRTEIICSLWERKVFRTEAVEKNASTCNLLGLLFVRP
jgi:hypothetical protein